VILVDDLHGAEAFAASGSVMVTGPASRSNNAEE
jgi:hypothetical protein